MDDETNEIVDLTRKDSEEESKEQGPMEEVQNTCQDNRNGNYKVEENGTEIQREVETGADIPESNGQNDDIPDAINSEIQADAEQELLKETKMVEEEEKGQEQNSRQEVMSNHEPKDNDVRNHHHHSDAGAADSLINNSHKEFLQVPTRMSTKKKRKDVHITLESTISDASKSSTDFSDSDRDHYNRKFDGIYERSGSCTNCRKSRACLYIHLLLVCTLRHVLSNSHSHNSIESTHSLSGGS